MTFWLNICRSIFFACLTEKGGKQTRDNATYSYEILHFIDSAGQKFEVFIGDKLLDKGAEMKANEVTSTSCNLLLFRCTTSTDSRSSAATSRRSSSRSPP